MEETGLRVKKQELAGIYSDPNLTVTDSPLVHTGHYAQFLVVLFVVTEWEGRWSRPKRWTLGTGLTPEVLPSPMIKSHPIRVRDSFEFNGKVFVR
ncbi:MAG: hypothetical protein R3B54_16835 [Bdellovibrionota bacterium]